LSFEPEGIGIIERNYLRAKKKEASRAANQDMQIELRRN
jgi:hypothetical protein